MNARTFHALTFAVAAFAVVLQFVLVVQGSQHLGEAAAAAPGLTTRIVRFASFLTMWSNILGTIIAATLMVDPRRDGRVWRALRLDAVVILVGGGIVHWFFLRPILDLNGWDLVADRLLHIVVPLLVMVGWLAFGPRDRIEWRDVGGFMILPVAWIAYTLIRGAIVSWYPYPFVDVAELGYGTVAFNAVAIGLLLALLAMGARSIDGRLPGLR